MSLLSGMRLNGVLSILLVALMVLGGMASLSSLQMSDAAAAGDSSADAGDENTDRDRDSGALSIRIAGLDDCDRSPSMVDVSPSPLRLDRTEGRQSDDPNHGEDDAEDDEADGHGDETDEEDETDEVDYHLPDHISVVRTATGGYVIRIVNEDGVVREEVLTAEEFSEFLEEHGWNAEEQEEETDEVEHDWVTDEVEHDWVLDWDFEVEEIPELNIEILDDGTIIIVREYDDEIVYDIIQTSDDGKTTIIRVTPWDTEVIHPQPPQRQRGDDRAGHGDRGGDGGMQPLLAFADDMSEDERDRCKEMLAPNRPEIDTDFVRPDFVPRERDSRD